MGTPSQKEGNINSKPRTNSRNGSSQPINVPSGWRKQNLLDTCPLLPSWPALCFAPDVQVLLGFIYMCDIRRERDERQHHHLDYMPSLARSTYLFPCLKFASASERIWFISLVIGRLLDSNSNWTARMSPEPSEQDIVADRCPSTSQSRMFAGEHSEKIVQLMQTWKCEPHLRPPWKTWGNSSVLSNKLKCWTFAEC